MLLFSFQRQSSQMASCLKKENPMQRLSHERWKGQSCEILTYSWHKFPHLMSDWVVTDYLGHLPTLLIVLFAVQKPSQGKQFLLSILVIISSALGVTFKELFIRLHLDVFSVFSSCSFSSYMQVFHLLASVFIQSGDGTRKKQDYSRMGMGRRA